MTQTVILECAKGKKLKKNPSDCSSTMMGKTQKFPKGHSSGFGPDFRQAIETVGESEGFGSSGRADSEDSCTPKRKCISLNVDKHHGFNVPLQVISASKMSGLERKDWEMRLRGELERIQMFQKKILSRNGTNVDGGVALPSVSHGHAKKHSLKRGTSGRFESFRGAPPQPPVANLDAMTMKQCEAILKNLMSHKYSWVFNQPVDVVKLKLHDYFTIIKHPMDLGTIKKKLASRSYSSAWGFASDVRLTFTNAMTYNPPGNDVHIMADTLNKFFEKKWKPVADKLAAAEQAVQRETEVVKLGSLPKKRKAPLMDNEVVVPKIVKPKMTYDEKQNLSARLTSLLEDLPDHIIDFLRQQSSNAKATEDEIEIDIEALSDDTLFELRKLLDDYFGGKQSTQQAKAEPCEIVIESGVSNSSTHPCKGNEPPDEDVDIGGDDLPVSSYPPVVIDRDTAHKSSKCSSSSSSSSDSGSSSSDSDSASSSGSDSDGKVATPAKALKENGRSEQEKCDISYPADPNRSIGRLDQQEHGARPRPVSVEADDHQEGENATSERQVSPDKLYRAALLRSRFADTILKAREKTLNPAEKKDPEKLRREREELERQQREEKARLQAEAKAAEDARRQAEAEAAAEAKRKRELEREAARQALLQMEKTVEINENSLLLKDLEMLRTAPGENIRSTVHEMNVDHLQEGMGGFNLGGSNALEQLGLFMKDDDEDDDEVAPSGVKVNDVEEGEID